ncbi:ABC transporter permease [Brevundimonas lenta]|uniref:Phospholipid/cholesterol/gamma-HCH transport system permease protein n=1 Tax=Brevundimonas lenta TaxID=424796 RepID=A0A7W6NR03_9CAUL|nr:ABC transporter permease [Brevundimonas lenta]MBB4083660.1 phospholipid/cholesterol/gamma-HCH transport system permease protein [Brevundimonas lenta]
MAAADFQIDEGGPGLTLRLTGDWTATELGRITRRLDDALQDRCIDAVDLSDMGRFDTAGALAIVQSSNCVLPQAAWTQRPEAGRTYAMVEKLERESAGPPKRSPGWIRGFAKIGRGIQDIGDEATLSMAFLGRLIVASGTTIKYLLLAFLGWLLMPFGAVVRGFDKDRGGRLLQTGQDLRSRKSIRWPAWFSQGERAGLDAIPIVAVTNFFIGAVIAFLGANLLTQFGAGVFTVQLVAVATLRELAVLITAILLAGRSASSFAAEIGSMRMNQEVDAMQVMGVNPFQALVIPRVAAMVLMLPLLTFIGIVAGMFGGMLVTWSQLSYGPAFFIQRVSEDPMMGQHLFVGMIKSPVFAIVIAAIGCRQGMAVAGDVESLGRRVTAAVVQAIFAIISLDAVFALIFLELNL